MKDIFNLNSILFDLFHISFLQTNIKSIKKMSEAYSQEIPQSEEPIQEEISEERVDQYQGDKHINKLENTSLPFLIESYNKEQRQRERSNRPKLGLRRLTDDRKLVSVDIDIPVDQNTVLKDKFDWDLSKDKISPSDFAKQLVSSLNIGPEHAQKIKEQILSQIMEHIKNNTRKNIHEERENPNNEEMNPMSFNNRNFQRFTFNEYPDEEELKQQNEKKKMSRIRRNEIKKINSFAPTQPNRYFKEKKLCKNCKNENNSPGFECKICKLPFQLMEMLNFQDKRIKISVKYYEKIANKIPLLVYQARKRNLEKEDFDSFYAIYNKIKNIFENSDQFSKENLNQVKYIMEKYHQYFLNGFLDFNDEEIIYDKEIKKDSTAEDKDRPKRQRGRPRKIKIINDDLVPNSNQNSENQSSRNDSDSSEYSSS